MDPNLATVLIVVGIALFVFGGQLVFFAGKLWKRIGVVMFTAGFLMCMITMFILNWMQSLLILIIFVSVTVLMYRRGWLPKI